MSTTGVQECFRGLYFLRRVSTVYSLKDSGLVLNLATRACGGKVVYPNVYKGVHSGILGGSVFYAVSLQCIV